MTNQSIRNRDAIALINAIHALDDDDADIHCAMRDILINDELLAMPDHPLAPTMLLAIRSLDTDNLSTLRLEYSLCPIHACDYAICFDDDDPDCASLRAAFPSHDT